MKAEVSHALSTMNGEKKRADICKTQVGRKMYRIYEKLRIISCFFISVYGIMLSKIKYGFSRKLVKHGISLPIIRSIKR